MKYFISILLLTLSARLCMAQDPCAGCTYFFIYIPSVGKYQELCANNPWTEHTDFGIPLHWTHGTTITYCLGDFSDGCFVDQSCVKQCVQQDFDKWLSICPSGTLNVTEDETGTSPCCIPIQYESDPNELDEADGQLAVTYTLWVTGTPELQGAIACDAYPYGANDHTRIHVDDTRAGRSKYQFVCPCPPVNCPVPGGKTTLNLCNVLAHEIGHVFGIQHTIEQDPNTGGDGAHCGCFDANDDDLMNWASPQGESCTPAYWTLNDMCMFQKLYCLGNPLSVASQPVLTMDPMLTVHPNPTTGSLMVQFVADIPGLVRVTVVNILGNVVINKDVRTSPGREALALDLSKLPGDVYIVRVEGPDFRASSLVRLESK